MTEKRHGKGLLFIVTLVLAAGVIKYADIPFAQTVREKAASALSGAANADHVLAVFGGSAMPADTVPAESSGGADDILDRDQTLFPDTLTNIEIVFCANLNRFVCHEMIGQLLNKITYIVRII